MPNEETIVSLPEPQPPFVYFSPTLKAVHEAGHPLPLPLPACASCPASGWYTTTKGLACFCTSFGRTVWNKVLQPVTACDGREKALARLAVEAAI